MRKLILAICTLLLAAGLSTASATNSALNLAKYQGKVVYLDFWASWCKPCRNSFPWMNAMQRKYGNRGLQIIGINVDEHRSDAERFLDQKPADFKVVFDPQGKLAEKYNLIGMPSSFLINRQGHIVWRHKGFHNDARLQYEAKIRALLAKSDTSGVAK